jgi:hypothetical protein
VALCLATVTVQPRSHAALGAVGAVDGRAGYDWFVSDTLHIVNPEALELRNVQRFVVATPRVLF